MQTGIQRGACVSADGIDEKTKFCFLKHIPRENGSSEGNQNTDICACAKKRVESQLRGDLACLRIVPAFRILQNTEEQKRDKIGGDIIHQNGAERFVHAQFHFEKDGNSCPDAASDHTAQKHKGDTDGSGNLT